MSAGTSKTPSMKSLKESCGQIHLKDSKRFLIASSPNLQSLLGGAIIASSCYLAGRPFHITFLEPVVDVGDINTLRKDHEKSTVLVVGTWITGKKRLRKGKGYPVFIGSDFVTKHKEASIVGNAGTVTAAAYVFAREKLSVSDEGLSLAGLGTVSNTLSATKKRGAHQYLLKQAIRQKLIEERKGFKVFGANSVSLIDAFLYSINPYLSGISGESERLEQALDDADISFSKRRTPVTSLTKKEAQQFTSRLIQHLPSEIIPDLLGQDYVVVREELTSPVRFYSSLYQLARLAWIKNLHGSFMSVLLGDRARQLRTLLDTQMLHSREVIRGVQRAESLVEGQTALLDETQHGRIIEVKGLQTGILSDVGQILLDTGPNSELSYLIVTTESHLVAVWRSPGVTNRVLSGLKKSKLSHRATTSNSLEIIDVSENTRQTVVQILEKTPEKG